MTVSAFLREYIDKYGSKKWVGSTYEGNLGLMENYVHPYIGDKDLISIKTKTVDDYYDFLLKEATPSARDSDFHSAGAFHSERNAGTIKD